jgi:hypothetical protein
MNAAQKPFYCHELALVCLIRALDECETLHHALKFALLDFCFSTLEVWQTFTGVVLTIECR